MFARNMDATAIANLHFVLGILQRACFVFDKENRFFKSARVYTEKNVQTRVTGKKKSYVHPEQLHLMLFAQL